MARTVEFTLNGEPVSLETDASRTLLWVLRTDLRATGTKYGCGAGLCGSCTVLVDGQAVRSCITDLAFVQGKEVTTIEGLANGDLHPLQRAFYEVGGYQCGYCTPGQVMSAVALLEHNPDPTRAEVERAMSGNLCRCGAYHGIVEAVLAAAGEGR